MSQTTKDLSYKMRWLRWRARLSIPALLTRFDEQKVVSLVTAVNGGMVILTLGVFAWLTNLPLLFPALGPSAFILFSSPLSPAAAPRSVVLAHLTCLICGYIVWLLMSFAVGEPVSMEAGGWPVFTSASLALVLGCVLMIRLSYSHPPACASALVLAMGGAPHVSDVLLMSLAIVWLTAQAVGMNRLAGLPVPLWSPRNLDK